MLARYTIPGGIDDECGMMSDELETTYLSFTIHHSAFIIFFIGSGETRTLTSQIKSLVLSPLSF
jgi:hypothetical protein